MVSDEVVPLLVPMWPTRLPPEQAAQAITFAALVRVLAALSASNEPPDPVADVLIAVSSTTKSVVPPLASVSCPVNLMVTVCPAYGVRSAVSFRYPVVGFRLLQVASVPR